MLSREENKWNFYFLALFGKVRLLPLRIDEETGRISMRRSIPWLIYFVVGLVYIIRIDVGFIRLVGQCWVDVSQVKLDHLFIHATFVVGFTPCVIWIYLLFIKQPLEAFMVFNELFNKGFQAKGREIGLFSNFPDSRPPRRFFTKQFEYSLHEFIALVLPFSMVAGILILLPVFLSDPSRDLLLYSSVPLDFQHWAIFSVLSVIDDLMTFIPIATLDFCLLSQLLFLQKCELMFQNFIQQIRSFELAPFDDWRTEKMLKEMRELALYITIFNRCYSPVIFSWKLMTLACSIFGGFFTIRCYHDHLFTVLFAAYVAINLAAWYVIVYDTAFTIVDNWKKVKGELRLRARLSKHKKYLTGGKMAEFQSKIKSIQEIGVKVGSFHVMERVSTPNFIAFVVSNISSLLITFS